MFRTSKTFRFSAGHALDHLEAGRQCARPHGHNYTVEVIMQARALSSNSFVRDPIDYRRIEKFIRTTFDQRDLNAVFAAEFEQDLRDYYKLVPGEEPACLEESLRTTTENIARAIFLRLHADFPEITAVRVGDTPDTWAEYTPDK